MNKTSPHVEFPYRFRKGQQEMVRDIGKVLESGGHIVIEAPTGFGKTISALYPAVKYAKKHGKKILYLVRTNSQEQKVVEESSHLGVRVVPLQGRNKMCPLVNENSEWKKGNPEELSILCSKLKKEVERGNENACIYYANYLKNSQNFSLDKPMTAEEIYRLSLEKGICPYELLKDSLKNADVVVAPYIYFFVPFIRNIVMDKMGVGFKDVILIIDEAHNLPDFLRELRSDVLSMESLNRMEMECREYGNPLILGNLCADVAEFLKESVYSVANVDDEEAIIPPYAWEEELSKFIRVSINAIRTLGMELIKMGEVIREEKAKRRKLPRSYIYHAGNFIYLWQESYSYEYLHLVKKSSNPSLEVYCLDPAELSDILRNVYSSISMSGTLDTKIYRNVLNLPENTVTRSYPWPFPKENLKIIYTDDVTTRYEEVEDNIPKIAKYVDEILSIDRNTLVLFPSYTLMNRVMEHSKANAITDERALSQKELYRKVENFRKKGGAIFSVFGGRIAEGLDFPGEQLEIVVIVGIPYPKPTSRVKMLEKYYEYKFGNGWEYAFRNPAKIKMLQAIGRLIRSPEDRGVVIILDRRIVSFPEINAEAVDSIKASIQKFFNNRKRGGGASS